MTQMNEVQSPQSDREIIISRVVDAPRELVWEAFTEPKHIANWWGPRGFSTTTEVMDVRVGGTWKHVMRGPDGTEYPNKSVFKEVVKPERLVYAHSGAKEGGPGISFLMTWRFDDVGGGKTKVTLHQVYDTAADRERIVREFGAIEGGRQTLERFSEYLPTMPAKAG